MDRIIDKTKITNAGYRLGNRKVNILCYADDALLMAENEDELQRLLFNFNKAAKEYNMEISIPKTKSMVISRTQIRCKLELENKIIEQIMTFTYLGAEITSDRQTTSETRHAAQKAMKISGALSTIIWRNKYLSNKTKVRIYKACVRPVLTYAVETRAETAKTKQIFRTTEMRTLRAIRRVSLQDRMRSNEIREELKVQDVVRWTRIRRRAWRDHVDRAEENQLIKWAKNTRPNKVRPLGRPPKRWHESWTSASQENA